MENILFMAANWISVKKIRVLGREKKISPGRIPQDFFSVIEDMFLKPKQKHNLVLQFV